MAALAEVTAHRFTRKLHGSCCRNGSDADDERYQAAVARKLSNQRLEAGDFRDVMCKKDGMAGVTCQYEEQDENSGAKVKECWVSVAGKVTQKAD
ncbi:hypothetical protein BGX29_005642 [Mortierella sp. GBA35]|nr:hypothetical protein BGX29_005642 [Mortierella sp. GBA35]